MSALNGSVWSWSAGPGGRSLRVSVCPGGNGAICKHWHRFVDLCSTSVRQGTFDFSLSTMPALRNDMVKPTWKLGYGVRCLFLSVHPRLAILHVSMCQNYRWVVHKVTLFWRFRYLWHRISCITGIQRRQPLVLDTTTSFVRWDAFKHMRPWYGLYRSDGVWKAEAECGTQLLLIFCGQFACVLALAYN